MRITLSLLVCFAAMLLQSCVALKPSAIETKKYALGPFTEGIETSTSRVPFPLSIYIQPPHLPGYLDGSDLVFQKTSGEVVPLARSKWAEPLLEGVPRALGQYLDRSPDLRVSGYYPWPRTNQSSARLSLRFSSFAVNESGAVDVVARWSLRYPDGRGQHGEFIHQSGNWAVGDAESLVAAYNAALKALADSITTSL